MSLQFYIGASGAGKSTKVYSDILKRAKEEPDTRFFIVVPDQFTMQTQHVLCAMSETGGIMNVEVQSFGRLAHRVFEELGMESLPRLDDTGKNLILRKVAKEHEKELSVIGANLKRTGYIAQVKSMISEFAQYGITPEGMGELISFSAKKGNLKAKLSDLQVLYQGYHDYIKGNFITTEENIDLLVQNVRRSKLLKGSVVVFDGFTGFTPIQDLLLRELMLHASKVIVTLLGDGKEDLEKAVEEQSLFYLTAKAYHKLNRLAMENEIPREEDVVLSGKPVARYRKNASLAHLEKHLFSNTGIPTVEGKDAVCLVSCKNPKAETEWVCLNIRRMIREEGLCYRDFAVITGDLPSYGYLLKESFAEHEIPLFLDQNVSLLYHPFMVFLNSLIRVLLQDFSYESVMTLLRSGYLDISDEEADMFEDYIVRYGMRGKRRYSRAFVRMDEQLGCINEVREKLLMVLEPLMNSDRHAKAYTRALYEICVANEIEKHLKAQEAAFGEEGRLAKAKEYGQVYGAVCGLFDQIYALLDEPMELDEYGEILKAGFAELKVGSIPQSVDQVVAGDLERTRLKPVKVLFIVGVNDGIIPGGGSSGGLLSDMERGFLLDAGIELAPTPRQKGFEERIYLYMNMTQPSEKLFLSCAKMNGKGESLRPSYLMRTIEKMYSDICVINIDAEEQMEMVESRESGLKLLAVLLREYATGLLHQNPEREELLMRLVRAYAKEPELPDLFMAAFYEYEDVPLSEEISKRLFGEILHTSVSRLEQFSACAYAHFLKYGLKLSEEEAYTFEAVDLGNLFHETLYRYGRHMSEGGKSWLTCSKEEADAFIEKSVDEFAAEYGNTVLYDTARNEAVIGRAKRILKTTVENLTFQLKKGLFEPVAYEMPFYGKGKVELYGKIDRVDTAKKDGKVYVKVMDYKSGRHKFDPARLFYGLDLQLAVYMNGALEREGQKHPSEEIVPAALFYYQIEDPIVETTTMDSEEDRMEKLREQLKVQGLIREEDVVFELLDESMTETSQVIPVKRKKNGELSSSSQTETTEHFDLIGKYASRKVVEIGEEIKKGKITVKPATDGSTSACDYCAYKSVCGHEKRLPGYETKDVAMGAEQAYEAMQQFCKEEETWQ